MELLFEYSSSQVDGPALDMIVRSSEPSLNRKLFVYILHRGRIWYWMKGGSDQLEPATETSSRSLLQINSEEFVFRNDFVREDGGSNKFRLEKLKINYSMH